MGESIGKVLLKGKDKMDYMSAYYVLAAPHHAHRIGGTPRSFLDQLHCFTPIVGLLIG